MKSTVSLQQLIDARLNGFAVELLAESINGHRQKAKLRQPFSFLYKDVFFMLSLSPDRDWTVAELLEVLEPISNIPTMDTFLVRFARAFIAAEGDERDMLVPIAVTLIDRYYLWKPEQHNEEGK